jgi:hypothetical protein
MDVFGYVKTDDVQHTHKKDIFAEASKRYLQITDANGTVVAIQACVEFKQEMK